MGHKIDDEEDMENFENDPITSRFMMVTQSSYGRMIDEVMKTFVTRQQELTNVEIREKMTLNLKYLQKIRIRLLCFLKIYTDLIIETLKLKHSASIY